MEKQQEIFRTIKAGLARQGITQTEIARRLGISQPTVQIVMAGRAESRRVKDALRDVLGFDPWAGENGSTN